MDIDLFSDIVKNLITQNDEVALPGLGTFVSELMPPRFPSLADSIHCNGYAEWVLNACAVIAYNEQ